MSSVTPSQHARTGRARATALVPVVGAALSAAILLTGCSGSAHVTARNAGTGHTAIDQTGAQLTRHDAANDTYGSLPSWLPSNSVDNNAPLTGTAADPAITSEGDEILAVVGRAHVVAEIDGPVVPGEGLPQPPDATTCTWRITVRTSGGALPLSPRDFNSLDHLGEIYAMSTVPGQPRIPAVVRPGHPVSFELRAVMPTGEGVMRWSPNRRAILGEWDFTVEND